MMTIILLLSIYLDRGLPVFTPSFGRYYVVFLFHHHHHLNMKVERGEFDLLLQRLVSYLSAVGVFVVDILNS